MPVGFIGLDHDWRITYINRSGEAVIGADWDALVGASYWDSFPANVGNEFGRAYREVVATGQRRTVEAFYPEPLNRWYEVHAVPVATGLSLYFTEVTAQAGGAGPAGDARPGQRRTGRCAGRRRGGAGHPRHRRPRAGRGVPGHHRGRRRAAAGRQLVARGP